MKKKIINPLIKVLQFIAVIIGMAILFSIFCALAEWSQKRKNIQEPMSEIRSYHSEKGLVLVEDGFIIIKPY